MEIEDIEKMAKVFIVKHKEMTDEEIYNYGLEIIRNTIAKAYGVDVLIYFDDFITDLLLSLNFDISKYRDDKK